MPRTAKKMKRTSAAKRRAAIRWRSRRLSPATPSRRSTTPRSGRPPGDGGARQADQGRVFVDSHVAPRRERLPRRAERPRRRRSVAVRGRAPARGERPAAASQRAPVRRGKAGGFASTSATAQPRAPGAAQTRHTVADGPRGPRCRGDLHLPACRLGVPKPSRLAVAVDWWAFVFARRPGAAEVLVLPMIAASLVLGSGHFVKPAQAATAADGDQAEERAQSTDGGLGGDLHPPSSALRGGSPSSGAPREDGARLVDTSDDSR